ncbi:unannotated protein [freshwater metagenome]|uniref:Unannotated protein n=1 Tax=freshwater metagenome TaxID=449393 RepID=A0A6J6KBW6_9ZZZZ
MPVSEYPEVDIDMPVPTVACAKVKVGVPANVVSSPPCTSDRPGELGNVTWLVASAVASY